MTQVDGDGSSDDEIGVAAGLAGLSTLVADAGTVEQLLTQVAMFTVLAIPGADGAGVTMLQQDEPDTVVASAAFVHDVDVVQYRLREGPCVSAATTGRTVGSSALGEDASWPTFGPVAARLGVHSALSLPLVVDGEVVGALNVYGRRRGAFSDSARQRGELFARPAAIAVHNARLLVHVRRLATRLQVGLTNQATIDQAVGIIRARLGLSAADALARLRQISDHERVKVSLVAADLVQQAVRDANAPI